MDALSFATEYVAAVEAADPARVSALFSADATVHSPLYGVLPATEFFARMLGDTERATLTLLGAADGSTVTGTPVAIWYFRFDWRLESGADVTGADMVDIAELDDEGKIASLTIVYDTRDARDAFER